MTFGHSERVFKTLVENWTTATDCARILEVRLLGIEPIDARMSARSVDHPAHVTPHHPPR